MRGVTGLNVRCQLAAASLVIGLLFSGVCSAQQQPHFRTDGYRGFAQPWELIEVAVAEAGRLDELMVKEGDAVQQGDLIARLDDAVLRASLEVAKQRASAGGEAESARARLNHAARRRDDIALLLEESHASQTELDQADLSLREAEAALLAVQERQDIAKAEVAQIQAQLGRREVRSPIDGVVIELKRRRGEYAGGSTNVVAKVAVLKRLRLRVNVPTSVALKLSSGMELDVSFPEIDVKTKASVDYVSPVTDSQSGTVRIDLQVDNQKGSLRSGLLGVWRTESASRADSSNAKRLSQALKRVNR